MSDDLKDRLRAVEGLWDGYGGVGKLRNIDGPEAADTIAALDAENVRLRRRLAVVEGYARAARNAAQAALDDCETLRKEADLSSGGGFQGRAALREQDGEPHSVLYRPSPVQGFSRAEIEAAQELLPVAEDIGAPQAVSEWLAMIAHKEPRE